MVITNPYAIKKSTTTTTPKNPSSNQHQQQQQHIQPPNTTTNNHNTTTNRTSTTTTNTTIHQLLLVPSPLIHDGIVSKYTTFSQAFDTMEETNDIPTTTTTNVTTTTTTTTHPPVVVAVPNDSNNTTTTTTSTTTAGTDHNPNHTTTHNNNNNHTSSAFTTDRDYHVLQQQPHVLYVSTKQHGNPILQYIRNVPFTYTRMVPDYIFSNTSCAIYLSCKYHILYKNYIHTRIAALKTDFTGRILLLYMDMDDTDKVLHDINLLCVQHNFTLILGWSEMEMARYIETLKVLQNRDASSIQQSKDNALQHMSLVDQMVDVLLCTKKYTRINKTDAATIMTQFHTIQNVFQATPDELSMIDGLGPLKVQRIYDTFHKPFSTKLSQQRKEKKQLLQQQQNQTMEKEIDDTGTTKKT